MGSRFLASLRHDVGIAPFPARGHGLFMSLRERGRFIRLKTKASRLTRAAEISNLLKL